MPSIREPWESGGKYPNFGAILWCLPTASRRLPSKLEPQLPTLVSCSQTHSG